MLITTTFLFLFLFFFRLNRGGGEPSCFAGWPPLGEAEELLFLPSRITNGKRILKLAVPAGREKQRMRAEREEGGTRV